MLSKTYACDDPEVLWILNGLFHAKPRIPGFAMKKSLMHLELVFKPETGGDRSSRRVGVRWGEGMGWS